MIYLGIDPGLTGGVAMVTPHHAVVYDMPSAPFGKGFVKNAVDLPALAEIVDGLAGVSFGRENNYSDPEYNATVYVEQVNAFPGQGVASMFSLGMSFYGAAGVCAGLMLPVVLVRPQEWKRHYALGADKNDALELARKMFPRVDLGRKKDHGKAEALLIAHYGMVTANELRS